MNNKASFRGEECSFRCSPFGNCDLDKTKCHVPYSGTCYKLGRSIKLAKYIFDLQARVSQLEEWQEKAFKAHPNIYLDIERLS